MRSTCVVAIGDRLLDRGDLLVGRGLPVLATLDPQLRFDLTERALGAVERQLQLARVEANERVANLDLGLIQEVRNTWQFYRDRRPETYGTITAL